MISAVVFDLDGTIIENEEIWENIFQDLANIHQKDWIHEPGIGILPNWRKLVGDEIKAVKLSQATRDRYLELKVVADAKVRAGFEDLVEVVKDRGLLTGLATGSNWDVAEDEIEKLNLVLAFDVITTGEEVVAAKPDPEIYALTCQKLGVNPDECLVIEDSLAGVESAAEAGCQVVGIVSNYASADELKSKGAKFTIDNLAEVVLILTDHGSQN